MAKTKKDNQADGKVGDLSFYKSKDGTTDDDKRTDKKNKRTANLTTPEVATK